MAKSLSGLGILPIAFGLYRVCCVMDGCHGHTLSAKVILFSEYSAVYGGKNHRKAFAHSLPWMLRYQHRHIVQNRALPCDSVKIAKANL